MFELKKIFVAIAGPVSNLVISIIFWNVNCLPSLRIAIVYANLLIAMFNLLPIYPLDGGRILKGILHIKFGKWKSRRYTNEISIMLVIILTAIASIAIYYFKNIAILAIIVYLWVIVLKENANYRKKLNIYKVIKTIENN